MESVKQSVSDEENEIARERRMADSGEYEPVDLSFVDALVDRAERLKAEIESAESERIPHDSTV